MHSGILATKEAINNTKIITIDRNRSEQISATMKFDVGCGLKGRKNHCCLSHLRIVSTNEVINNTQIIVIDRNQSERISATIKFDVRRGFKGRKKNTPANRIREF